VVDWSVVEMRDDFLFRMDLGVFLYLLGTLRVHLVAFELVSLYISPFGVSF
jgi:hypothetical protein